MKNGREELEETSSHLRTPGQPLHEVGTGIRERGFQVLLDNPTICCLKHTEALTLLMDNQVFRHQRVRHDR